MSPIPIGPLSSAHVGTLSQTRPSAALLSQSNISYAQAQPSSFSTLSTSLPLTDTQNRTNMPVPEDLFSSSDVRSKRHQHLSNNYKVPNLPQKSSPSDDPPNPSILPLLFSLLVLQLSLLTATVLITISALKYNKGNNKDPGPIIGAMLSLIVMAASAFGARYEWGERKLWKDGYRPKGYEEPNESGFRGTSNVKGIHLRDLPSTAITSSQRAGTDATAHRYPIRYTPKQPSIAQSSRRAPQRRSSKLPYRPKGTGVTGTASHGLNPSLTSANSFETAREHASWI